MTPNLDERKQQQPDTSPSATSGENGGDKPGKWNEELVTPRIDREKMQQALEQGAAKPIDAEELRRLDMQTLDGAHGQATPDASKEVGQDPTIRSGVPDR